MAASLDLNLAVGLTTLSILTYVLFKNLGSGSNLPLPPGPKKLPIVGNLFDMPNGMEWLAYEKWGKELNSDIIHVNVMGTSIIVVNSVQAANELFERRSSIYSGRPRMPMLIELSGREWIFGFMQYGERWREHRTLIHKELHPTATLRYRPHELKVTRTLLRLLLQSPQHYTEHLRYTSGAVIMSIAYGIEVKSSGDPYLATAEKANEAINEAGVPGAFLVDAIPMLKYVPSWMPGAGFKTKAKEWYQQGREMVEKPFEVTRSEMESGVAPPSFVSYALDNMDEKRDTATQKEVIQHTAATMYVAGTDTSVAAFHTFFLAMLLYPDVQTKAQGELDEVIGKGNLPDFTHESSLPYITAIVREIQRWRPVAPIAVPHSVTQDDEFNGYRIPAGSVVVGNAWAMLHNEAIYPEPSKFNPDRFMKDGKIDPEVRDPTPTAFGFGRRSCPGMTMAVSSIWIVVASILAAFDITKATENGVTIEPSGEYSPGLVSYPTPFKCSIQPRSSQIVEAIHSSE